MLTIVGLGIVSVGLIVLFWFAYTLASIRESLKVIRDESVKQTRYLRDAERGETGFQHR
jgi:hypothetical protein